MFNTVHRITFPLMAVYFVLLQTAHAQTTSEPAYFCTSNQYQITVYESTESAARNSVCQAALSASGSSQPDAEYRSGICRTLPNFFSLGSVSCGQTLACPNGDGSYSAPNPDGSCPQACPEAQNAEPFDTPDCGCSDPDYQPVNLTGGSFEVVGCVYEPECPEDGTPAAQGCTGPNGVDYDHSICLPIDREDHDRHWCRGTYIDGIASYSGGRGTAGCPYSRALVDTSDYGCDQPEETSNRNVDTETSGTPDAPTTTTRDDKGTPDDPSDDTTVTRSTTTTESPDGSTTTTSTTRETTSDGDTTTTTTTTRRSEDGTTTTTTTREGPNGERTVSGSSTGGSRTCEGPDCDAIENDGEGTTAGQCGSPPKCTGKPIECAMLAQEYNLQCGVSIGSHLDCNSPLTCEGDPLDCAIIEQNKQQYCTLTLTEGFEESESLLTLKVGIDDGSDYFGTDGTNEINLSNAFQPDDTGLGWASSCPASYSFSIYGETVDISFQPLCDWLIFLNPLLLLIGYVHAGFIFMRGVTGG